MRNGILNRSETEWPNANTRLKPGEFYEPCHNEPISIHEMGVCVCVCGGGIEAFNDSMGHLSHVWELKREEKKGREKQ